MHTAVARKSQSTCVNSVAVKRKQIGEIFLSYGMTKQ